MNERNDVLGFFDRLYKRRGWILVGIYVASYSVLSAGGRYYGCNYGGQDNADVWIAKGCGGNYHKPTGRLGESITPFGVVFFR